MLKGGSKILRTIREADLETLFERMSDVRSRGETFPVYIRSEPLIKKQFNEAGFWSENKGRNVAFERDNRKAIANFRKHEVFYENQSTYPTIAKGPPDDDGQHPNS